MYILSFFLSFWPPVILFNSYCSISMLIPFFGSFFYLNWVSLVFILVYVGALLILFFYIVSLTPNVYTFKFYISIFIWLIFLFLFISFYMSHFIFIDSLMQESVFNLFSVFNLMNSFFIVFLLFFFCF